MIITYYLTILWSFLKSLIMRNCLRMIRHIMMLKVMWLNLSYDYSFIIMTQYLFIVRNSNCDDQENTKQNETRMNLVAVCLHQTVELQLLSFIHPNSILKFSARTPCRGELPFLLPSFSAVLVKELALGLYLLAVS